MTDELALRLAERVDRIKPSPTLAVAARAEELQAQGEDIINLSIGEPDFDTPDYIKQAAIKAIEEGHTKYTAVDGIKPLKKAIQQKFLRDNQLRYELNQIIVSCGAKHSFYNLFCSVLNKNDEVLIPAPFWVSYPDIALLADAKPIIIKADISEHFKLSPEKLAAAITPKTRLFVLNSPSNPSGMAYSAKELLALGKVLSQHPQILIATDDIYEKNLWNHTPFTNILNVCPELYDRTVVINGVSKTYAMTGWRIGYAAGPVKIIAAMKKIQSQSTSNPTSISQYATIAALEGDQDSISIMTKAYKERHDFVYDSLKKIPGIECIPSDGTFYSFVSVEKLLNKNSEINNDVNFSEYLLNEAGIAVIPGSAFGLSGYIRISYATSMDDLKKAMERLHKAIIKLG